MFTLVNINKASTLALSLTPSLCVFQLLLLHLACFLPTKPFTTFKYTRHSGRSSMRPYRNGKNVSFRSFDFLDRLP
ncbi:hypothetical protein DFH29DRAFT_904897 [Suillus ampliporus]|nr:hypothetical protein DFH29DRAFT_904897 [Suillus ampliporus]